MDIDTDSACWIWPGDMYLKGYGCVQLEEGRFQGAHRFVYERLVGPIAPGLQLHHECRQRACVNPAHLRPITAAEHGSLHAPRARTHCKYGHALTEANVIVRTNGKRRCRTCFLAKEVPYWRARNAAS